MPLRLPPSTQPNPQRSSQTKPAAAAQTAHAHPMAASSVLQLQRLQGNRAVQRMLANHTVQAKLTVGAAHDKYEAEADQMAAQVVNAPTGLNPQAVSLGAGPAAQRLPLEAGITQRVQRSIDEEDAPPPSSSGPEEEEEIQTKRSSGDAFETGANFESQLAGAKSGGQALPGQLRRELEPKFGADFSSVQVHTDATSAQLNRAVGAQAFTHHNHIYMGPGSYNPGTTSGKQLLAHELTHTVQQGAVKSNTNTLQKKPAAGLQRMTVKFLPKANDTYVNPMAKIKMDELGETAEAGVYKHKGYALKPGETAVTERAATRKVALNETLNIVAHGNERQMQGGMNAAQMAAFIKTLLPDLPGGAQHSGNVDLTGCLTAWKPFWNRFKKPLAQEVAEIVKLTYPKVKVRGYEGIMHVGTPDFGISPIEITPWAYKIGKWVTYKKLYNDYLNEKDLTKERAKKKLAHAQYKKMEQSGSIRRPSPKSFG